MSTHPADSSTYCSYVIRVWKESFAESKEAEWRFVLLIVGSERPQGFTQIEPLIEELRSELIKHVQGLPT